jgi:hypothetical protein
LQTNDPGLLGCAQVFFCRKVRQYWIFRSILDAAPSTRISTVGNMNPFHTQTDKKTRSTFCASV